MDGRRILMVSSEVSPWARSGGLADVIGALPGELAKLGHAVAVVCPRYMNAQDSPAVRVLEQVPFQMGGSQYDVAIWSMEERGVTTFFVEHAGLYDRPGLYGDSHGEFGDNHRRFGLLCLAAIEIEKRLFPADIFHCHDWQSALVPVYLQDLGSSAKTLLTIHNLGYQGLFDRKQLADISIPDQHFHPGALEFWGKVNLLKGGIVFADALNTVSRRYAEEIQTNTYGFGLDGLLRERAAVLSGIVNGIDYTRWNPATDTWLPHTYSPSNLSGKRACKEALLHEAGLPARAIDRPLFGVVSRFAGQKGFDLVAEISDELFEDDICLVALGSGEAKYEDFFRSLQLKYPDKVSVTFGYHDGLAHRIEGGSDMFLMPSQYEPCGLNQIYSLKYGTVPVVRATGGLDDTIDEATGFKFTDYNGSALLGAIRAACQAWEDRGAWQARMLRGMEKDFSWAASAREYSALYSAL